jgi:peptidoglycan/LPS O-acetylase OafA/YrhL
LRGLAALVVLADHVWQSPWNDPLGGSRSLIPSAADNVYGGWTTIALWIFGNGLAAVNLFFVISGFVLLQSLARGPKSTRANTIRFIIARLFRIYPAAIATIGIFLFVFYTTGLTINMGPAAYSLVSLLRNALLIDFSINGVMWTLKLEVIAIPLFIVGFVLFQYSGISALTILLATLLILARVNGWSNLVDTPFGFQLLPFFAVGMIVFAIGRKGSAWCPPPIAILLLIVSMFGMLSSAPLLPRHPVRTQHIEMVCDGLIVGLLAFGNLGMIGRFFDRALVRFYGRISYSFYLVNPLTLLVCWHIPGALGRVMQMRIPGVVIALMLFVISVVVTTPVAWLMHKYVERPGIAIGRLLITRLFAKHSLIFASEQLPFRHGRAQESGGRAPKSVSKAEIS